MSSVTIENSTNRHWALFADWCVATGRTSLPATADTVLGFLTELPAGPATTRRRIGAIDTAHLTNGHRPPSAAPAFDHLLRPSVPPRFDPAQVGAALGIIPVGGWPIGITGRRDAALIALVCSAGLTRYQVQGLRTGPTQPEGHTAPVPTMATTEHPGSCPACAVTRWLRIQATITAGGSRDVRHDLADLGEITAGSETTHDCAQAVTWPQLLPNHGSSGHGRSERGSPLFSAIDRHGSPELNCPLSTRSITTIVAARLTLAAQGPLADPDLEEHSQDMPPDVFTGDPGEPWGEAHRTRVWDERKEARQRLAAIDDLLDEADAYAEAILQRLDAALGDAEPE